MHPLMGEGVISMSSIVAAAKDQVSTELASEAIILDLKSGVYYGLDEVGARIWQLIQASKTVGEIRDAILAEYEVEPMRCEHDLLDLLQDLATKNLIEFKDGKDITSCVEVL